jgi:uridylate kinase
METKKIVLKLSGEALSGNSHEKYSEAKIQEE